MTDKPNPRRRPSDEFLRKLRMIIWSLIAAAAILTLLLVLLHHSFYRPGTAAAEPTADADGYYTATLAAVGDISLSEKQLTDFQQPDGSFDCEDCFAGVFARIASADLAVGNFEGTVSAGTADTERYCYPAAFTTALHDAGFDILQTANSRSLQGGAIGLQTTLDTLRANGIEPLGTFSSQRDKQTHNVLVREVNGIRFAFIAFTKGMNNMRLPENSEVCVNLLYRDYDTTYSDIDEDAILSTVSAAKNESPDVIVAMLHWGSEDDRNVTAAQKKIAALLLDNGVNVILGSHSHIVGAMDSLPVTPEAPADTFVAYSLGDFMTVSDQSASQYGCILNLTFQKNAVSGQTTIREASYTPTYCAAPSRENGISHYRVYDSVNEISLYESVFYTRVSDTLYEKLLASLEALESQTAPTAE